MSILSTLGMIRQLRSHYPRDMLTWEKDFIASVWDQSGAGTDDAYLPNNMIDTIRRMHFKYFGEGK